MNQPTFSPASFIARSKARLAACLPHTPLAWLAWTALPLALGGSFVAFSAGTAPSYPPVNLATSSLYSAATVDKPALALALSVEFPTVGSQYNSGVSMATTDATYTTATAYLGYYDAESCYRYIDAPTDTPTGGLTASDYKRFDRSGAATGRSCTDAFSGNFLNWASSSAIDMLRLALSGGDRYIDTTDLTILQRAVLPDTALTCALNSYNFPAKQLSRDGGGTGNYWGAVPAAMRTAAGSNDVWVANVLNRIYFGTARGPVQPDNDGASRCNPSNYAAYNLGGASKDSQVGPVSGSSAKLPKDTTSCAGENGTCSFTGILEVWYGAKKSWKVAPASNGVACTNGVFGDPINGTYKYCYTRPYSGSWKPTAGTSGLNSDGFFYARVQVCNVDASGVLQDTRDYAFCKQYPNAKYKPTGVIQKYSDQLRLAAFGYLMDENPGNGWVRYGGVLRAPMKYVGAKTFDINGNDNTPSGGNPAAEWNATTGVFNPNPDGDTSQTPAISGVINYLNKFGRTGPVPGRYKYYDPIGELHYETLRYLQGLPPSAEAISAITANQQDGFPVYTSWTDPYGGGRSNTTDYACVKSNIVVVGDKNTHDRNRLPTPSAANNIPDIAGWRGVAQAFEANNTSSTYTDGQGNTQPIANPNTPNGNMPTASDSSQIIGSAYWANTHDIRGSDWTEADKRRPGLRVKTMMFDVNEYGQSSVYATRSTTNQLFMAAKYGGFETDPSNKGNKPYNTKGNPFQREASPSDVNDNAVWQKPGGDPLSYYLQSDARGVLNAFDDIFSRAATAARSIAGAASSSSSAAAGTSLYSASFDTSNWSGDVVAESITQDAGTKSLSKATATWSAAEKLNRRDSPATSRNIVVGKESPAAGSAATNFTWDAIGSTLQGYLNKATPASTADSLGQDRLNYLRGDRSKEGNPFRVRSSLLGDIINSTVVYSGAPARGYGGAAYAAFTSANASRTPAVFVGANDGMLHAFNASSDPTAGGAELFGYIPSWVVPQLPALTDPAFANAHQNYVDAPIAVDEAQVATSGSATDWKTVLVSGTGGGGHGVFALDVTDPTSFGASKVMWEFKRSDDAAIGQVIGQPRLMKFKTSGSAATATYRWFAVVASGVNNYVIDAAGRFSDGKPALFLLALDKPADAAWSLGSNYYRIDLPVDATLAATTAPGVVNFNALYGSAGEVTDIYAGDLHGKLWKLSFGNLAPNEWTMDKLSFFTKGSPAVAFPMFIAKTGSTVQPITAAPTLFTGPILGGVETFYVTFGTGKYLEASDKTTAFTNSFYTVYDNGSTASDVTSGTPGNAAISGRGRLQAGTVDTTTKTVTVAGFKWGRPTADDSTTARAGWYFDLPVSGERLVSHVLDIGPRTGSFNTVIPGASGSTGTCAAVVGSGNQYVVDVPDGSGRYVTSVVGLPGPSMYLEGETSETKSDSTGRRMRTTVMRGVTVGQQGVKVDSNTAPILEAVGRLSWRQIYNYRDQKS